jgi:amphi-Trp domain-containing protein
MCARYYDLARGADQEGNASKARRQTLVAVARTCDDGDMELIEIEESHRVSREDAAKWLRRLADSLERHNEVEFVRGGIRTRVEVPDEIEMEVELELGDECSLEVELSW